MNKIVNVETTNMDATIEDGFLVLRVDLSRELGPSASKKTTLIASSRGNQKFLMPDGVEAFMGVNIYRK